INAWVAGATRDHIKDLIPPSGVTSDTRLALVNAVYRLAEWRSPFRAAATGAAPFHLSPSEIHDFLTMHADLWVSYAALDGTKILEMPYKGGAFAMTLVLPDPVDGLEAVEARLSMATLQAWTGALAPSFVRVALP